MTQLLVKAAVSGMLIAVASEVARRSAFAGAVLISLPLASALTLAWLYAGTHDPAKVASLSWSILWIIVPSLVFFVALPLLIRAGVAVPWAIVGACVITAVAYVGYVAVARRLGAPL